MILYSRTAEKLLIVETERPLSSYQILDPQNRPLSCPILDQKPIEDGYRTRLDASALSLWTLENPVLYQWESEGESFRFGFTSLSTYQNQTVLFNDAPIYLRGFIRGIVAHDHPNMTGQGLYEAARKNILQAKKYGFNFVRFHSTIPSEEFVRAADELGLLIHMEIGFAYEYDENGRKKKLSMSNTTWEETLLRYRNHPSVAVFCIGNELHNAGHFPEVAALVQQGRRLAPGKLIMDNSGWGEYDRPTADIYSQHVAYFFPMGVHRNMFLEGESWQMNGSVSDEPLHTVTAAGHGNVSAHRATVPLRPMLSHEAMHYIDIPDYEALNAKYDAFAASVGEEYLKKYGIEKPRYLTELPMLIRQKGLTCRMPDYIAGSAQWKRMAVKVFLERLRLSPLCGFEMLQFSDCLKYENKNGFVDFFDDDKSTDPAWLRKLNADLVLLADYSSSTLYTDETLKVDLYVSDYLPDPAQNGTLTVKMDGEILYSGSSFMLTGGLQKLLSLEIDPSADTVSKKQAFKKTLTVHFSWEEGETDNAWDFWFYPRVQLNPVLQKLTAAGSCALKNAVLPAETDQTPLYLTDTLDEDVFAHLEKGDTVLLNYSYGASQNRWQMPGAMERFKPCIWDRGSNLGGILYSEPLQKALACGRYFDLNLYDLLEAGSKVNLDDFPFAVEEHCSGIDKPVRDRMKGLQHHIKNFIAEDTLRQFSHLFSVKVGKGLLVVCTFNLTKVQSPAVASFLKFFIDHPEAFQTDKAVSPAALRSWLDEINSRPFRKEDVMNHYWEIDNKLVEDALFWEEVGIDLRKL